MFDFLNGPVREAVTQVYNTVGYLGVALWVAIESVIVPIPSELVLPFAGFLVGEGRAVEPLTGAPWNLWLVTLAGTIGATVGALAAFFGRMIPVIRSLVSFAAGVARMPLVPFVVFTFLGSLPFTFLLVFAGIQLGANWVTIGAVLKQFEYAVVAGLVAVALVWIWFRILKPRRARHA